MCESGDDTVQQIADGFGVTRPIIYRGLSNVTAPGGPSALATADLFTVL
ncbi:hypothetical protein NGB36_03595 [Streptomyces sp. RB6PN25]|uniref:Resolvase HTH domain-containing protein n=1 Tax=Streptomyces humicola TaxID=2953240 RepID=A0ABT1PT21_9ACTN|nr:hypothetical protein [Streptomyces humicola]MCQ4079702.1 hypothetical protein [Streptomyces humicola]